MASSGGGALLRGAAAARRLRMSATAAAGGEAPVSSLYRRLSALGNAPDGSVAKTMNQWLREGRRVRSIDVVRFATKLQGYGRFNHALELMEWMEGKGMILYYSDHALRLALVSKVEGIAAAEKYFYRLSSSAKTLQTYEALLSSYCTEKMEGKAIALYETMKQLNYTSSFIYNNLMTLHMKLGQPEKVPPLRQQMMSEKVAPDVVTYNILLNSYASLGDIVAVEELVKTMKEQNAGMLKWSFYGSLASFYISSDLVEKAESALKMFEKTMDVYKQECYHHLISLYARTGNLVEVKRVWDHLKAIFPRVTNKSYFTMITALDRLGEIDALKHCFEEWESWYSAYDLRLATFVVKAYLRRDMINDADSLLQDAVLKSSVPDLYIFQVFIDYFLEKQRTDLALRYMGDAVFKIKNQVWKPSKGEVELFLSYIKDQNLDGSDVLVDSLKNLDFLGSDSNDVVLSTPTAAERRPSLYQLFKEV
ncbi:hypothetical protein Taro_053426 [Colocasia esculenta]|uniref:Pentatricopeptide repeat-containing protein n=1 Tax=Colocasia esculenta TaxID=4460 RepID=A0A843XKY9_COLES|nr:hypothetical protein [Colocasia esculenta]